MGIVISSVKENNEEPDVSGARNPFFSMFWLTMYGACTCQAFITICYRFDYFNSTASISPPDTEMELLNEPASSIVLGVFFRGRISSQFSKPYYMASIVPWCFVHIVLLTVAGFVPASYAVCFGYYQFGLLGMAIAMPLMLISVLGLAAARGELKQLWMYQENWSIAPNRSGNYRASVVTEQTVGRDLESEPLVPKSLP